MSALSRVRRSSLGFSAALTAFCLVTAQGLAAQPPESEELPLWEFRVAAFGRYSPAYPGAADHNLTLLPLPYPVYRGSRLRFGDDLDEIAEGRVLTRSRIDLDINFNVNFGADSEDISVRQGMPDLDLLLEIGPELEIKLNNRPAIEGELLLALQLRAAVSFDGSNATGRGVVFSPEVEYRLDQAFGTRNDWSARWRSVWASEDYADYYYEVAPRSPRRSVPASTRPRVISAPNSGSV